MANITAKGNHTEGQVAKAIETQTAKIPSDYFLWGGLGMLAASITLHLLNRKQYGQMFGQLASPLLMMGLYNKTVKQQGHDYTDNPTKQQDLRRYTSI